MLPVRADPACPLPCRTAEAQVDPLFYPEELRRPDCPEQLVALPPNCPEKLEGPIAEIGRVLDLKEPLICESANNGSPDI